MVRTRRRLLHPLPKTPRNKYRYLGRALLTYIREHKKLLHTKLMINGTLYTHLAEINQQAAIKDYFLTELFGKANK